MLRERESWQEQGEGAEGEVEADTPLSRETHVGLGVGFHPRPLGSWREWKVAACPTEPPRRPLRHIFWRLKKSMPFKIFFLREKIKTLLKMFENNDIMIQFMIEELVLDLSSWNTKLWNRGKQFLKTDFRPWNMDSTRLWSLKEGSWGQFPILAGFLSGRDFQVISQKIEEVKKSCMTEWRKKLSV